MNLTSSIGKFVGSAVIQMTLLSSCTYDYDQFSHDTKASTSAGSSSGDAAVGPGQGGNTAIGNAGGTTDVGSDAGQSSLGGAGGSSGNASGGSANNSSSGGTAAKSSTNIPSGGDLGLGGNGGTSGFETGGTSNTANSGGTSAVLSTGGQSPTGGSSSAPLTCGSSQANCGTVCADLSNDAKHCGQCNIDCTAGGLSFGCYGGVCGCTLPTNCGSGSGVDCVNHLCACSSSTCSPGQVCQKHGNTQSCATP